jgi:hypothetical protein
MLVTAAETTDGSAFGVRGLRPAFGRFPPLGIFDSFDLFDFREPQNQTIKECQQTSYCVTDYVDDADYAGSTGNLRRESASLFVGDER